MLFLLAFLWGGSFTLIKVAVVTVPPATIVLGRLILGTFLLLLYVKFQEIEIPRAPATWASYFVQGFFQSALPFTLICWGESHIDSGLAGLLNSTPPLFALIITIFILREGGAHRRNILGVITGFIGVLIILSPDLITGSHNRVLGQLAITGSSLSYAVGAIYARRFSSQPAALTAACSMAMATVAIAPVSFYFDLPWILTPSIEAIWSIGCLGVFSTAIAMVIYFRLIKTLGPIAVSNGSYLRAGFSVVLGILFLNEDFSLIIAVGFILILLSVAIVSTPINLSMRNKSH